MSHNASIVPKASCGHLPEAAKSLKLVSWQFRLPVRDGGLTGIVSTPGLRSDYAEKPPVGDRELPFRTAIRF